MGQGIALALHRAGWPVALLARSHRAVVAPLTLHPGDWGAALQAAELIVVATPDDAIPLVAADLAATGAICPGQIALHLAGRLDGRALAPLEPSGAAVGSFHPLQTVADPASAPERLRGAYAGVEGDPRAVAAASHLAAALGMVPVALSAGAKALYHAGAVFVANYTVTLAGVAERLAQQAGVPAELATRLYAPLLEGTAANVSALGARHALTGPIRRADLSTIQAHLAVLRGPDRALYVALGRAALRLAEEAGLPPEEARAIAEVLDREQ
jgi:predicted short-subunit dehydrogenase-like oxidoreductase (DUF2520 family)